MRRGYISLGICTNGRENKEKLPFETIDVHLCVYKKELIFFFFIHKRDLLVQHALSV